MNFASALMNGAGDFAAARAILDTIPYPRRDASGNPSVDDVLLRCELLMLERDFAGAEKVLVEFPLEEFPPPLGLKDIFLPAPRGQEVISSGPASYSRKG